MEVKEEMKKELNKYFEKFEKYDNELIPNIDEKISENKEKIEEFKQKWSGEIFPTDVKIKDEEENVLNEETNKLNEQKEKLENEVKNLEDELKKELYSTKGKIHSRMNELVTFIQDKDKYAAEKEKLTKELEKQVEGVKTWEENGIKEDDVLYQKRKYEIIPNLENNINELNKKLDENLVKQEWKDLKELDGKINSIVVHDRKYLMPELKELLGMENTERESENVAEVSETENTNNTQEEDLEGSVNKLLSKMNRLNPISKKTQRQEEPEIEQENSSNQSASKINESNPSKQSKTHIVIGRKINLIDENGNIKMSINSKDYFKYIKDNKNSSLDEKFSEVINDDSKTFNIKLRSIGIDKVDPIVKFALLNGLKNELLKPDDVLKMTVAIAREDKQSLNKILPIKWDKNDLSKGAFWPWNRKQRDEMASLADKSANIMDVVGEYEPNPIKRLFGHLKQPLLAQKEVKQLDSGEKQQDAERSEVESAAQANNLTEKMQNFRDKLSHKVDEMKNPTYDKEGRDNEQVSSINQDDRGR